MAYNAELQMLREFYLMHAHKTYCVFCSLPIASKPNARVTFGHRRHTKVWELNYTVHHDDENRDNNAEGNLKDCHSDCHRRFHKQLLLKGGKNKNGQNEEGQAREEKETLKEVVNV